MTIKHKSSLTLTLMGARGPIDDKIQSRSTKTKQKRMFGLLNGW